MTARPSAEVAWRAIAREWYARFLPNHGPAEAERLAREETTRELGYDLPAVVASLDEAPAAPTPEHVYPTAKVPPFRWGDRIPLPPPPPDRTGWRWPHPLDRSDR